MSWNTASQPIYIIHSLGDFGKRDLRIFEKDGQVIPIEVKSGKEYYVHSAISKAVSNPEYEIDEGIVFANCNVSQEGKINYLPVFMCAFLQDDVVLPVVEAV